MSGFVLNLNVLVFAYIIAMAFAMIFAGTCLEYRGQRIVKGYIGVIGLYFGWLVTNLYLVLAPGFEEKIQFALARFVFIAFIPPSWVLFTKELFRAPHQPRSSKWVSLVYIFPMCIAIAALIPGFRSLLVSEVKPFIAWGISTLQWSAGPLLKMHLAYSYACLIAITYYCIRGMRQDRRVKAQYGALLLFALSFFSFVEVIGIFFIPEVRFLGIPALTQLFSPMAFYYILHRQQVVRAFSQSSNLLFESLPTPVILTNADDDVLLYNSRARDLFSFDVGSAGHRVCDILPVNIVNNLPAPGLTEKGRIVEVCPERGDHVGTRYFEVITEAFAPMSPLGGGRLLIFNEVTEIHKSTQTNQRLISLMSHDLLGNLSSLEVLTRNRSEVHWELIADTSKSAADLLKNLLLWSSTQGSFYQPHKETLVASPLIRSCIDSLMPVAELKKVAVNFLETAPDLCCEFDKKMFSAILRNMLSNAIKHAPANSTIEVLCFQQDNEICLKVRDQGEGISSEIVKKILTYSGDTPLARSSSAEGYGIGLFVILHFLKMHGGRLEISQREGGGSVVAALFPA